MCKMYNVYIMYRQCVWQRDMSDTREKQIVPTPGEHCLCPPICHTSISSLPSTSNNHAGKNIFRSGLKLPQNTPHTSSIVFNTNSSTIQPSRSKLSMFFWCSFYKHQKNWQVTFWLGNQRNLAELPFSWNCKMKCGQSNVEECCRTRGCGIKEYLCN